MKNKILLATMLVGLSFAPLSAYNGKAAANYALKYVYNHNPSYVYYVNGGDCTNFASQAMKAGGMTIDRYGSGYNWQKWTKYSASWQLAPVLEERFRKDKYSNGHKVARYIAGKYDLNSPVPYNSTYRGLGAIKVGDIIFFDWRRNSPHRFSHTVVVTSAWHGFIYVTFHSSDSKNVYLMSSRLDGAAYDWKCYRPISYWFC